MIKSGVLARIVDLERAVLRVAEEGFPAASYSARVGGGLAEILPVDAIVVGIGDCDAEVGVCALGWVLGMVSERAEYAAGEELEHVGVVDVVGV